MEGQVQLGTLSSTTHCGEEVQGHPGAAVPTTPRAQRPQIGKVMDKAQQISSGCILKWCLFLTFKMLVWGEAAQQATLVPLLLQEAKGKVPAERGHLDPAGKGSSSSCSPSQALGLGQRCRKAPACGAPRPGGFRGAASLERWTQIPEGISHTALKQWLEGFSSLPCDFVVFGNLRNVGM